MLCFGVEVIKLLILCRGSKCVLGCLGWLFECVYLRIL